jgi:hypothetical protein
VPLGAGDAPLVVVLQNAFHRTFNVCMAPQWRQWAA